MDDINQIRTPPDFSQINKKEDKKREVSGAEDQPPPPDPRPNLETSRNSLETVDLKFTIEEEPEDLGEQEIEAEKYVRKTIMPLLTKGLKSIRSKDGKAMDRSEEDVVNSIIAQLNRDKKTNIPEIPSNRANVNNELNEISFTSRILYKVSNACFKSGSYGSDTLGRALLQIAEI